MVKKRNNKALVILAVIVILAFMMQGIKKENIFGTTTESGCNQDLQYSISPGGCYTECFYVTADLINDCNVDSGYGLMWIYYYEHDCYFSSSQQDTVDCLLDKGIDWSSYDPPVLGCSNPTAEELEFACRDGDVDQCDMGSWNKIGDCSDWSGYTEPCKITTARSLESQAVDDCTAIGTTTTTTPGTTTTTVPPDGFDTTQSASVVGDKIRSVFSIKNKGASSVTFLLETQIDYQSKKGSSTDSNLCDSKCAYNVHKWVTIAAGATESVTIDVPIEDKMPDGTYYVDVVSGDKCCPTNPDCQDKGPYGLSGTIIAENLVVSSGINAPPDLCPTPFCGDEDCSREEGECYSGCDDPCPNDCTWEKADCQGTPDYIQSPPPNNPIKSCYFDWQCGGYCQDRGYNVAICDSGTLFGYSDNKCVCCSGGTTTTTTIPCGTWTPSASTVACGQSFTQKNDCTSQQATGTSCESGKVCKSGTCVEDDDGFDFDFEKYMPWVIGFVALMMAMKMMSAAK